MVMKSGVPNCWLSGRPLLKKREKWRTPSCIVSTLKDNPRYTSHVDLTHQPVIGLSGLSTTS